MILPGTKQHLDKDDKCVLTTQQCEHKNCADCPTALQVLISQLIQDDSVLPINRKDPLFNNVGVPVFSNPSSTAVRIDGEWCDEIRDKLSRAWSWVVNVPTEQEFEIDFALDKCTQYPFATAIIEILGSPYEVYGKTNYPVIMVYDDCFYVVAPVLSDDMGDGCNGCGDGKLQKDEPAKRARKAKRK